MKKTNKRILKILKILGKVLGVILIILLVLILFIRSPWGQDFITGKAVSYVSGKTNTEVAVEKLYITFAGDILLNGLYLEDKKGDTLVYSRHLEADIPLWPIISGNGIGVDELEWSGVRANVYRTDSISGFNYQFLIDAFASSDTTTTQPKDTSSINLSLGRFAFEDIKLNYDDQVSGMQAGLSLGSLDLQMEETHLDKMHFEVGEVALRNTQANYKLSKASPATENSQKTDSSSSPLPRLGLERLVLSNVQVNYESVPDGLRADAAIKDFLLKMPLADLNTNTIEVNTFGLQNSKITLEQNQITTDTSETKSTAKDSTQTPFVWPDFKVKVADIDIKNNDFGYYVNGQKPVENTFNPEAVQIRNFVLQAADIDYEPKKAGLTLEKLAFAEASGIRLDRLGFNLQINEEQASLDNLQFQLDQSRLGGNATLNYQSVDAVMQQPEQAQLNLNLNEVVLNANTAFTFQPELKSNTYLQALAKKPVTGSLKVNGKLDKLNIPQFKLNWGQSTAITAKGTLSNAMDSEQLAYNFSTLNAQSTREDLGSFVNQDSLSVTFPERLELDASLAGTTSSADARVVVLSTLGKIYLDGNGSFGDALAFDAQLKIDSLQLGTLLKNEQLGALTFQASAQGSGKDLSELDAQMEAAVLQLTYNNYAIENLKINGKFKDGSGTVASNYKDENLNLNLDSKIVLDTSKINANLNLNLIGADLQALGLTSQNIKAALKLKADFNGNAEAFTLNSNIDEGIAVYDNESYLLGDLDVNAYVRPDTTAVDLTNRMLDLHLESNTDPGTFSTALQRHITSYLSDNPQIDTIAKPVKLKVRGTLSQAPILNEVLVNNLNELDTVNIEADFDEANQKLSATISAPFIDYNGNKLDSLALQVASNKDSLNFNFGFRSIEAGPALIKNTQFNGRAADKELKLDFSSYDDEQQLLHIASTVFREDENIKVSISPKNLVLNRNNWSIPQDNRIILAEDFTRFQNFILSREGQQLEVSNALEGIAENHLGMEFKNFNLSSILSYLNPDQNLASGALNGRFAIVNPTGSSGLLADLEINDLHVLEVAMGKLALDASSSIGSDYDFDMGISGGAANLDLTGSYAANPDAAALDLDLNINEIKMEMLQAFSFGELENAQGSISGNISLSGTTTDPVYDGTVSFNDAGFEVAKLNNKFFLRDENLKLDNAGIYFDNFSIEDPQSNAFTVNGKVGTEDLLVPTFDLSFKTTDFQVLNSTAEDFDLVYGKLSFDAEATLTGDLNFPKVDMELSVGENTDVTYVIPPSQAQIESMDGVVVFVNKENPEAILTESEEESYVFSGLQVDARLKVNSEAIFNVIVDEQTGDNLQVRGDADLDFGMEPNGRMSLTGVFEATDGHYELSLYNLVNRRFEIAEGSRVTWSGDPFNAALDVSAIYDVETAASGLMVNRDPKYKQEYNFEVYLNVDGELMAPVISFNLDMPKEDQGAVGGNVYARVQQLNQQENQLNKQVFSLLVLNKFFPSTGSDGASGGTASIARDNINDAISDQLNTFSDKLLGNSGVDLDFGLDSYQDYQSGTGQDRTTLDVAAQKKLFNDRLIVRVGSEVDLEGAPANSEGPSPVIGNVSLEYLLTEDGQYRLKGFRKNEFENIIDGQLIISGISLIFTREFNQFDELWRQMFGRTEEEEETQDEN